MFKPFVLCALLIVGGLLCLPQTNSHALPKFKLKGTWKLIKKKGNIKVYQMKVRGSRLIAMKGETVFDAPIGKLLFLLNNVSQKPYWVGGMTNARLISQSSPDDYVAYLRFNFPWPTSPRDFLTETRTYFYPNEKKIVRYQYSITRDNLPPRKGIVRAALHYSRYTLTSLKKGTKTHMIAEGYGDPKGTIPSFIVNFIQRRWPLNNIRAIQGELKQPYVREQPSVKTRLFAKPTPKR